MEMFRWLVMFAIAIAMAVLVVWERNKIIETGYQIAELQKEFIELSERNKKLDYYVLRLKSPEVIVDKVKAYQLALLPQQEDSSNRLAARKRKKSVEVSSKTIMAGNLYTQKESIFRGYASHN